MILSWVKAIPSRKRQRVCFSHPHLEVSLRELLLDHTRRVPDNPLGQDPEGETLACPANDLTLHSQKP